MAYTPTISLVCRSLEKHCMSIIKKCREILGKMSMLYTYIAYCIGPDHYYCPSVTFGRPGEILKRSKIKYKNKRRM